MKENEIYEVADLFKMFSDATRLKIMLCLFEEERSVSEIVDAVAASQTAVSHQLRALKQNHLVKCRRSGKNMIYSLADAHVKMMINCAIEHVEE